ncbi:MAG TPA: 50S ribosomal protein L11 methyltransferase [Thermoplasmata archaeon]|nr:50S ribosomal protein L11 methyltransferase [Thermoplasmata archaeon]
MRPIGVLRPERRPPAERVRDRLRDRAGAGIADRMPAGYQRLGRVLLLRLPETLRPYFAEIGAAWQAELKVATVLAVSGPVSGEFRTPQVERIAGTETETEVVEHGIRWKFDAARIMFAAGNRTERVRVGRIVQAGETVVDLFAGIGYFAIPAARPGRASRVVAVEKNPVAIGYLRANVVLNGVADRVEIVPGDNRTVRLTAGDADRVFLGYLPSAIPWIPVALEAARPAGSWLHVHTVADAREAREDATEQVGRTLLAAGWSLLEPMRAREVKPYGPGRTHVVVDAHVCRSHGEGTVVPLQDGVGAPDPTR